MMLKSLSSKTLQTLCERLEQLSPTRDHKGQDVEDLVQEALLKGMMVNAIRSWEGWLMTVAVNVGIAAGRKARRRDDLLRAWSEVRKKQLEDSPAPELEVQEELEFVRAAVHRLPGQQRQVVRFWMTGVSFQKIAEQQVRPVHHVRADFKQALKTLRSAFSSFRP
jgi:RNA polymerase sigma factor (sigma-70 family)